MDFQLTEEQLALQRMAREFAEKEMKPVAAKYDRGEEFPWDVIKKAFEVGFLSSSIPEEYGGGGLSTLDTVIVSEELAAGCAGMFTSIMANSLALTPIILFGTEEQKKKFLTPFTKEMMLAAFCLTEREAGSDAGNVSTIAKKVGSEYVINGSKCFITNGGVANLYVVFANTAKEKGARGISAFIVPADTPGIKIGKIEDKMGHRASNTAEIFFEDVKVSAENLLGKEGMGFLIAMKTLDKARPSVGAAGVGVAKAALEYAIEYAKTRIQFGRPIASFQHIAFKLADMATEINAARHLVWHAAWLIDKGMKASKESAMAKAYASDVAMRVTVDALQIFGGYGYMKDFPMEKLMRDAKLLQIYEGTNEIQRLVISREIIGPLK
ncbi:acyl-CoA dehydrogenase family protein [SCandidatus Aminicenantes bacterium Aminicenantia_JdfR_composite]|nr:acyl-CoA dehydrogenase family protein [SCandidatus Aminicenantes bacterium Aminicenantia_JdfR_composite]MCP2597709.1 acyl-CoA dehydrogenase family protein [Candidatus Aminicenantes bacterium AC-335-G13]MCP2598641.1 acyl-CoA dehydrogenase family protein [Candidatus Aminicenantes bacterium AC-335-L06]MCP2620569.1 acyl-CoA dehydrogenase family protein [Candidatus Aminicenantes bacterium AC-334-E05]